jgi:hypothetical protein
VFVLMLRSCLTHRDRRRLANALIIRPRTDVLSPTSAGRAAQYVRMSTEHQRYSTENQAAAIAVYAAA